MKLDKEDSPLQMNLTEEKTTEISNGDLPLIDGTTDVNENNCPKCTGMMTPTQEDKSVQCELLTDTKTGPFLEIIDKIKNGIRQGNFQSTAEVMEEVPYDKSVATLDENAAPDETILVTRSFENEAVPQEPRRSSIAVVFDAIKALGSRLKSEPIKTKSSKDEIVGGNYGNECGQSSHSQNQLYPMVASGDECQPMGKNSQRKSFQLDNGTVVEEETAEYEADEAVSTNGNLALGEVNFISRSFEVVQENPPGRKESLIDKINPLKIIEKIRRGSQTTLVPNNVKEDAKEENKYEPAATCSGIRRKSLIPALLSESNTEEDNEGETDGGTESKAECIGGTNLGPTGNGELVPMSPIRFVTAGVRRGSVAGVSADPPCRGQAEDSQTERSGPPSSENNQEGVRLITEGIRRGSVAMVSAAPPCRSLDEGNSPEGASRINNVELCVGEDDCLRSGVRRRSLGFVNDGSQGGTTSPAGGKRVSFGKASQNSADDEYERERKSSDAADEFMNRVTKRYNDQGAETKERKKGAVSLFEQLTGREIGVDYSPIDAKKIQEKLDAEFDEKHKTAPRLSIPVIMFTEDVSDEENLAAAGENVRVTGQELDKELEKAEEAGTLVECSQGMEHEMSKIE